MKKRKQKLPTGEYRELPTLVAQVLPERARGPRVPAQRRKRVARRMLRSREGDVEHGIPVNPKMGRITFEDAADDILNDYKANHRRSLAGLNRRLRKHLLPYFRGRRLGSIPRPMSAANRESARRRDCHGAGEKEWRRPSLERGDQPRTQDLQADVHARGAGDKLARRPTIALLRERNVRTGFFEPEQFEAVRRHLPAPAPARHVHVSDRLAQGRSAGPRVAASGLRRQGKCGSTQARRRTTKAGSFRSRDDLRDLLKAQHAEHDKLKKAGTIEPWVFWESAVRGARGRPAGRIRSQRPIRNFGRRG